LNRQFEKIAVDIIDEGYKVDPEKTRAIVTRPLDNWRDYTCADFAVSCERASFVAHPTVQNLFDELWTGPLTHTINIFQFLLVLVFPAHVMSLTYRKDSTLRRLSRGLGGIIELKDWSFQSLVGCKPTKQSDDK